MEPFGKGKKIPLIVLEIYLSIQKAIDNVEKLSYDWGFKLTVTESGDMPFTRKCNIIWMLYNINWRG
uniref:Uncharacterized protein n=1 Tax=Anguilla anguilla TaxID=7936 RepID=A0A0E9V4T8_ANGAN